MSENYARMKSYQRLIQKASLGNQITKKFLLRNLPMKTNKEVLQKFLLKSKIALMKIKIKMLRWRKLGWSILSRS